MKILLKGGTVVSGTCAEPANILLCGETIEAVGQDLPADGARVLDMTGKLLFPGFIDAHTHFDLDVCNTITADDFASGTRSALRGGTTTILDFACPNKGESLNYGLKLWHEKADGRCACDYGFHMTIDDWNDSIRKELEDMFRQGVSSFKMYMTYPAMMLEDKTLYEALETIGRMGGIVGVHCENSGIIDALTAKKKSAGALSPASHPAVRPAAAEAEAVSRLLRMAQIAGVPVVIVHLSAEESLKEVRAARARGQRVFVETCPQYLYLDASRYENQDYLEAAKFVCAPPLRSPADQAALWQGLADGTIQTVSTDHCSFTLEQKMAGKDDFTAIPGGLPGAETRGILLYEGAADGRISLSDLCRVLSENPAKLYGMWPRKGALLPGSDADIVVLDPAKNSIITAKDLISKAGYTSFEGIKCRGTIQQVWLRGTLVMENGKLLKENLGKYIHRGKGTLE